MPIGKGKYDDLCTYVREKSKANAALVIVLGGEHGPGFSMQTHDPRYVIGVAAILRDVAQLIEDSLKKGEV